MWAPVWRPKALAIGLLVTAVLLVSWRRDNRSRVAVGAPGQQRRLRLPSNDGSELDLPALEAQLQTPFRNNDVLDHLWQLRHAAVQSLAALDRRPCPRVEEEEGGDRLRRQLQVAALSLQAAQVYVHQELAASVSNTLLCDGVFVGVTTTPARLHLLLPLLHLLAAQSLQPSRIVVALPPIALRTGQYFTSLPTWLTTNPLVAVVPLDIDYGPVSKLAGLLHWLRAQPAAPSPAACLVTVDDDTALQPHALAWAAHYAALYPRAAVGCQGWNHSRILQLLPASWCGIEGSDPASAAAAAGPAAGPASSAYWANVSTPYLFVRAATDAMCSRLQRPELATEPDAVAHCWVPVSPRHPRAADVLMGTSTPLYRYSMFTGSSSGDEDEDDLLQLPRVLALQRARELLAASASAAAASQRTAALLSASLQCTALPGSSDAQHAAHIPPQLYLTDDVLISAYLARQGIPRLVYAPAADGAPPLLPLLPVQSRQSVAPIQLPLRSCQKWSQHLQVTRDSQEQEKKPMQQQPGDPSADALHAIPGFDEAHVTVVEHLRIRGWW